MGAVQQRVGTSLAHSLGIAEFALLFTTMKLTSRSNARIKQARKLKQRKWRDQSGLFLVEGLRHVGEAVEAGAGIEYVIYAPSQLGSLFGHQLLEKLNNNGVDCLAVAPEVYSSIAEKANPQGIIAVTRQSYTELQALNPDNCAWGVAVVNPQDPGNVGTILRTMDAVGADALILLEASNDPFHHTSVRASMGSLFWHPVVSASFESFAAWARQYNFTVYGTSARGSAAYNEVDEYVTPRVLLLGSERQGLSPEQAAVCQHLVRLPMQGRVTSLNLAVAAGIMMYSMHPGISNRS